MKVIPVIMAGGKGERFWPMSRIKTPKQCLSLLSDKPLIVETYDRLSDFDNFYIVANNHLCGCFKDMLPSSVGYVVEPIAKNTAAAIGLSCIKLLKEQGDCVIILETADHYYRDVNHYISDLKKAADFAIDNDNIVLLGIKPNCPHTGYGHIKNGAVIGDDIYGVECFVEKPDLETAKKYVASGDYMWNSGIFVSKCSVMLEEIKSLMPDLHAALVNIADSDFDFDVAKSEFEKLESISVDYGIMEKSDKTVVLNTPLHWDDVGDFNAISRLTTPVEHDNYSNGDLKIVDSSKNIVLSKKLVALVGVDDLIVVETDDAILVCNKNNSQDIKKIVASLDDKYK